MSESAAIGGIKAQAAEGVAELTEGLQGSALVETCLRQASSIVDETQAQLGRLKASLGSMENSDGIMTAAATSGEHYQHGSMLIGMAFDGAQHPANKAVYDAAGGLQYCDSVKTMTRTGSLLASEVTKAGRLVQMLQECVGAMAVHLSRVDSANDECRARANDLRDMAENQTGLM